ncbi:SGNH/GDSL hydrolase family protein [Shewanella surugensis]|uniref:SGNH/GDSL hydrolase family protein n=1 Tax=Shewanella surugensis TaxID=212020 RepID=A0ABT0LDJ2_9GAMM|nr:SGNH/GDSL hydrolase family protein [Shewanella surugensis]MCL1125758.1 SGNH/GDSL hydrolase family protein [Shewanella surugensis]
MKKYSLLPLLCLSFYANADTNILSAKEVSATQEDETKTYVKCWYRTDDNHNQAATDWEWALKENGNYYKLKGYWYSANDWNDIFYTETTADTIQKRCEATLDLDNENADITFFAANSRLSHNHSIWTNEAQAQPDKINKIVSFGDSISDTGNFYNFSQGIFPNDSTWFLGHFSNGFVWTEYLAKALDLPLHTWAIGGAAGEDKYIIIKGITGQIETYLEQVQVAKNYQPQNTLVTLEVGLNDFVSYDRTVAAVSEDLEQSIDLLMENGIENILLLNLIDASKAPQFKYATDEDIEKVQTRVEKFNAFIDELVPELQAQGLNITLYDAESIFEQITTMPENFGLRNANDSCLDINENSSINYLQTHALRNDCSTYGSDNYVFWGVSHPTTQAHKIIADDVINTALDNFNF